MADKTTPVVIYAAGLGRNDTNTADRVAEVVARAIDRNDPSREFSTKDDAAIAAPRGLKVAKTIIDATTNEPVLQFFELDYAGRLDKTSGIAGPPVPPGVVRSAKYVIFGVALLAWAWKRPSKRFMTKLQLALGFAAVGVLVLAWLVALYAALIAAGLNLPKPIAGLFGEQAAGWTFGVSGTAAVVSWAALRKKSLAFAATTQHLIDYVRNDDRVRETVCLTVDDAVDGLRNDGWVKDIHLLGYSFGSLVLFDAAYPKASSLKSPKPLNEVASLVTIGCPIDLVRLYFPKYANARESRKADLEWRNVFNAADVFASNLQDKNDVAEGATNAKALTHVTPRVTSVRYQEERLTLWQLLFARGFRTHAGYWGTDAEGSCFEKLVEVWVP